MIIKNVHVIINPASGQPRPILYTLNKVLKSLSIQWDVSVTQSADDAFRFAKAAIANHVDAIIVCGGDGTQMEVASALVGLSIPLLVIPTGTGNVLATELGIPHDIKKACELVHEDRHCLTTIDMGQVKDKYFLLRISAGFEAELVKAANRKLKTNIGWLAYALSGFKALMKVKPTHYQMWIDGQTIECQGLSYVIANSGNLGLPGVTLSPQIDLTDGLLDVFVIRQADLHRLFTWDETQEYDWTKEFFQHWQAKEVHVKATPPHNVHCDGEFLGPQEITASIIPQALRVIVPNK